MRRENNIENSICATECRCQALSSNIYGKMHNSLNVLGIETMNHVFSSTTKYMYIDHNEQLMLLIEMNYTYKASYYYVIRMSFIDSNFSI